MSTLLLSHAPRYRLCNDGQSKTIGLVTCAVSLADHYVTSGLEGHFTYRNESVKTTMNIILTIIVLCAGVYGDFLKDCNPPTSTLVCRRATISIELTFPGIHKIYVTQLDGFTASKYIFPNLKILIVEQSHVSCPERMENLPNVAAIVNGKDCSLVNNFID